MQVTRRPAAAAVAAAAVAAAAVAVAAVAAALFGSLSAEGLWFRVCGLGLGERHLEESEMHSASSSPGDSNR